MFLKEIVALLENKLSPKIFSLYPENYGIQYGEYNEKKIVKRVLITLDLSLEAIHYAIKKKVNLIISHHGLINKAIKKFNNNLINKLSLLSRHPLIIFILNYSFIAAEGGISDTIMEKLYLELDKTFDIKNKNNIKVPLGRISLPKKYPNQNRPLKLIDLIKRIKTNMNLTNVFYVGDLDSIVKKICIVGGEFQNIEYLEKAIKYGCDCYISGKINHFEAVFARDVGLNLVETSHYSSEIFAMKRFYNCLSLEFPYDEFFWFDSKDPFHEC
ncbi:MAG: Nif3-like dinuclear metal center hexameric protein [Promethearchaeota archaeon]